MIRVSAVAAERDYSLLMTFSNGERRRFDMKPYLHLPVYRPLADVGFFEVARVDYGTVVWPGEIDIAPETLYECSAPVMAEVAR